MNVAELLNAAADLATEGLRTDGGLTIDDIRRDLDLTEWELALGMLEDVGDEHPQTVRYWQLLAEAAELMHLERSAGWCRWRAYESANGVIRADLGLIAAEDGGRQSAIPGPGVLRAMWDIGHRNGSGEPDLAIARIWVEFAPTLEPGQQGSVRLAPLAPQRWRHLSPGDLITMHETAAPIGIAEIISVLPPAPS
jgi:hypothetical protein